MLDDLFNIALLTFVAGGGFIMFFAIMGLYLYLEMMFGTDE